MAVTRINVIQNFIWSVILLVFDIVKLFVSNLTPYSLKNKKSVKGEIVLVTGGGSGFGRLLSINFAKLGARIVVWDVDEAGCQETKKLVEKEGSKIDCYIVDVSKKEEVYKTAQLVREQVGDVTILINNAGIAHSNFFMNTTDALLEKVMAVNTMAHFWTLKAFLPNMIDNNHGHIVCISSVAGLHGIPRCTAYSSSKHAVIGLMDSISLELIELGKTGVKTTIVCPFFSNTPLFETVFDGLLPMVKPETVAEEITKGVLTEKDLVYIPKSGSIIGIFKVISTRKALYRVGKFLCGDSLWNTIKIKKVFSEQDE